MNIKTRKGNSLERNYFQRSHSELIGKLMLRVSIVNGCWFLNSGIRSNGYSRVNFKNKSYYGHRLFFQYFNWKPKRGYDVCHRCDNRNCVNPAHLFEGTRKENMKDCVSKNRQAKGEVLSRKLVESDVRQILSSELSNIELAEKFNVTRHTIANVRNRKTWKHVEE